jgi:DNA polymerase-3 subunit gamma/tau
MGQALYRKYRSKSLSEIVGQEHITKTLEQALKTGRISHAYLFTGPHGVGKTSIARILAHEVNGLPYTDDSSHIDIIEIDAASNRRIDEIRELREKVYVAPTSARYKVYIIDEVHMLTREAFNALLKTLEEPPAHVIFILATTDAHKLPETIVSRTQRFTFKPVETDKVIAHLREIALAEHITISDEALRLLAEHGQGSFRDSISLLDQASNQGSKLEADDVLALLGIPSAAALQQIVAILVAHDEPAKLFRCLSELFAQGYQAGAIAKQLGQLLRGQLIDGQLALPREETLTLLRELIEVPVSSDPERLLEIVLLQGLQSKDAAATPIARPETDPAPRHDVAAPKAPATPKPAPETMADTPKPEQPKAALEEKPQKSSPKTAPSAIGKAFDLTVWPQILEALKKKHNTLYGVARMAQPEFAEDGTLKLLFSFAFHQKRLNEAKNRQVLADTIEQITGQRVAVECLVDKAAKPYQDQGPVAAQPNLPAGSRPDDLVAISNIFGGGELLES